MSRLKTILILTLTVLTLQVDRVRAWEVPTGSSVEFVPADASFYSSSLQLGKQLEAFTSSRAFAKLKGLPVVQMGLNEIKGELEDGDLAPMRAFFEHPDNAPLVSMMKDAISHEVFMYGGSGYSDWLAALSGLGNTINMASMRAATQGEDPEEAMQQAMLDLLNDPKLMQLPSTMLGFRLKDTAVAESQLQRLEKLVNQMIEQQGQQLAGRFSRETIGDGNYLVLKLDGSMVPWDQALADSDLSEDAQQQLIQKLSKMTLSIHLGLYKDYLILATGKDDATLRKIGSGDVMIDSREIAPLKKYFNREVFGLAMVSGRLLREVSGVDRQMDQLDEMFQSVLPMIPVIGEDVKQDLEKDASAFFAEIKALQPRLDSVSAITYGSPGGYESVSYNWSEIKNYDDSKPLTILNHVGGDPIGFYAARFKPADAEEAFARRWMGKLGGYVERIAVPMLNDQQSDLYEQLKEKMLPLAKRLGEINEEKMKPAFADGQFAIVLDSQIKSNQWHQAMPRADEEVSLPEVTMVWGVSDADKLRQGASENFEVLQDALTTMSEIMPDQIPPIQLPRPREKGFDDGSHLYRYMIPPFLGVDPAIAPNAAVNDNLLAISLIPKATERVLESKPLNSDGVLGSPEQKEMASAWQFKMHRLVQMARPWVKYGFQLAAAEGVQDPEVASQVNTVLDVLECIRTSGGYSHFDGEALVTHSKSTFKDLDE